MIGVKRNLFDYTIAYIVTSLHNMTFCAVYTSAYGGDGGGSVSIVPIYYSSAGTKTSILNRFPNIG